MIDWEVIKAEYLTTDTSYRRLAKKYKISLSQLADKAKREDWVRLKNDKAEQIGTAVVEKADKARISEFESLISLNERLIKLAEKKIKGYETLFKDDEQKFIITAVKDLKGLADTLNILTNNVRNLKSIPTQSEEEAQKIAQKRLEIEEKKADIDTSNKEIKIIFEGNADEIEEFSK